MPRWSMIRNRHGRQLSEEVFSSATLLLSGADNLVLDALQVLEEQGVVGLRHVTTAFA